MWKSGELISKVLSPALRLWLRSQVDSFHELDIVIEGKNRQILQGYIPRVSLSSNQAVYQGLHLGNIQVLAENIRINIGQILKGKPLELLEPIQITGQVSLDPSDLSASLDSLILPGALTDLLEMIFEENGIKPAKPQIDAYEINWEQITLQNNGFNLKGNIKQNPQASVPIRIQAKLNLLDEKTLQIIPLKIEGIARLEDQCHEFSVDLGDDVKIETFNLEESQLYCAGSLMVYS